LARVIASSRPPKKPAAPQLLRLLIVEDSSQRLERILKALRQGGYDPFYECVDAPAALRQSLLRTDWDAVLSGARLDRFRDLQAFEMLRASGQDLPFFILAETTDLQAVLDALHAGVRDYFVFNDLPRMILSLRREIEVSRLGRAHRLAWEELRRQHGHLEERVEARTLRLKSLILKMRREINERQQAEEALRESEQRFRLAVEYFPASFSLYDVQGRIQFVNRHVLNLTGFSLDKLVGRRDQEVFEPRFAALHETMIAKTVATQATQTAEFTFACGGETTHLITFVPLLDEQGAPKQVLAIAFDITARKRAEKALRRDHDELERLVAQRTADLLAANQNLSQEILERKEIERETRAGQELLERIFSGTNFLMALLNTHFDYVRVNRAFSQEVGRPPEFFLGKNHFALFPDQRLEPVFRGTIVSGEMYTAYDKPFLYPMHPESGLAYWDWSLQPVKGPTGRVEGLLLVLVDVSKRKWAEEELAKIHKELNDAKRLSDIGTLAATVAHELRNPLGVILTATYNVRRKAADPKLEKHLANIEKKVRESDQIINNLLHYSRIKTPQYEAVSLKDILEECLDAVQKACGRQKVQIQKQFVLPKDEWVEADPYQLREIFTNVLNNAFQALYRKTSRIRMEARRSDRQMVVTIQDNGCGIDKDDCKRIFEPFFTRKSKGTGLGLTICKELVALHGGTIDVHSGKNRGTMVRICLPAKRKIHRKKPTALISH
jgi:PAS domain S-box-containing protein